MLFPENRGFFTDIHGHGGITLSKPSNYKVVTFQPSFSYGSSLYIDIFSLPISAVFSFNQGYIYESFPSNGIVSRGFTEVSVSTGMEWRITNSLSSKFEIGGSFANYYYSELYFVFPFILVEPILEVKIPNLNYLALTVSSPIRIDLRRDLDFSINNSLSLALRFYPFLIGINKGK